MDSTDVLKGGTGNDTLLGGARNEIERRLRVAVAIELL